ncbi:MAG: methionine synthase [Planctomycetes bacterium]|nr:methionine synthase [Planctomycetota bacterium]
MDGAMGTSIHALDLPLSDYRDLENCIEILNETRPDAIEGIHRGFLEVGCDAVETNTFGANKIVLAEYDIAERAYDLNVQSARIARKVAYEFSTPERPRFVIGSIGPGTKLITLRQVDYDTMLESYAEQARGLIAGGVDALSIETCQDILQCKTAVYAARTAMTGAGVRLPLIVHVTMETTGTMLVGTDIAAALVALDAFPEIDVIGLNCATGPQEMSEHIRHLARRSRRPISVMPNAGLPRLVDGKSHFPLAPDELAKWLLEFVEVDGVALVGGCCGTTPIHMKAVVAAIGDRKPGPREVAHEPSLSSTYQAVTNRQDSSFLIVGERSNTNGSRKFKRLLVEGDIDGLVEMGKEQLNEGSHVLDVCVDYVGRDGVKDMTKVADRYARHVNVPLMLDSTEPNVIEAGLKLCGGKCIVNSVNLEDGEEKMSKIAALLRQYGAAVVALTIDEDPQQAMAKTADRKLSIAVRIHDLLTNKYGVREEDIFFDCLTFPITTGNQDDRRLALETLDGIEAIMKQLPRCQTILGLSNVSFGLQPASRAVLNSVFLFEARQRGLTAAIVHVSKILPRNKISDERWQAALDLIYDRRANGDPLTDFMGLFEDGEKIGEKVEIADLPIEERLKQRIIDGRKQGLDADLDLAMQSYKPLEIVNTFLLDGMKVVGELFGSGQMQLPFVLKSAETMKAAVAHLEPHMDRTAGDSRGSIVLATVRGDVHDIGKNLVDIILSNNGYTVYNLGIKQPINNIIAAWKKHNADAIGLSGLLVKSTVVMRDDLAVLNEQSLDPPVILGGAALTRSYVEGDLRQNYNGPLYYAKDAFEGLHLIEQIVSGRSTRKAPPAKPIVKSATAAQPLAPAPVVDLEAAQRFGLIAISDDDEQIPAAATAVAKRSAITCDHPVPHPPFWGRRVLQEIPLKAALGFMNEVMLFQVQWQYRKRRRSVEEFKKYIDTQVRPIYRELVEQCQREGIINPAAVYGYWPCNSDGDDLIIYKPPVASGPPARGAEIARFTFPRQSKPPHWCLSDFWRPLESGQTDVVAFSLVTAGQRVSEVAHQWFSENRYQQYLFLHGLGVETAEALAEYIHKQVRVELGIAASDARDMKKLFQQGYQGSRFSFGYPACPRLEDQATLLKLLEPEEIGVTLSDGYQLDPEQSTSAVIAHHPDARYFNVR